MSKWSWLEKLISGEKITISTVDVGLSYKIFVPCERPQFSDLVAAYKELLAGVKKILKSKTVEVVEDPEPKP